MISIKVLESGDLLLSVGSEGRESLIDLVGDHGTTEVLKEAMENHWVNGQFFPFTNGDNGLCFGLTEADMIAEYLSFNDDGTVTQDGGVWFFGDYMITSPVNVLLDNGEVTFRSVEQ